MEWLTKISELTRIPTKAVAVVAVASGLVLFAPEALLHKLHLQGVVSSFGLALGVAFLLSSASLIVELAVLVQKRIARRSSKRAQEKREYQQLSEKAQNWLTFIQKLTSFIAPA